MMPNTDAPLRAYFDPILQDYPFAQAQLSAHKKGLNITLPYPCALESHRLREMAAKLLQRPVKEIALHSAIEAQGVQTHLARLDNVKNIIAIASGKGGVGKSTLAINLAIGLFQQGATVGLLDADIYGPSQAHMLGGKIPPDSADGKRLYPVYRHDLQTLSIADLVEEDSAMIWRGPIVTQTLIQLLRQTNWHELDYLLIDLPPGTGDVQLTLAQQIPVSGAVIVTTPQEIALLDAKKAKVMFDKVNIAVLGLVENMSYYHCPNCGHQADIFATQGGVELAKRYDLPLLGQLPLDAQIRKDSDDGNPTCAANPHSALARLYQTIALRTAIQLAHRPTTPFPKFSQE